METKQTAVQWLYDELSQCMHREEVCDLVYKLEQKAKQMEREQIEDAHFTGSGCNLFDLPEYRINSAYKAAQQYYGEKFGENYGGKDE